MLALALITISFRESDDGPLHDAQAAVASALQPLTIAVERVARPFRDAYGWTADLFAARSENERLRAENEQLRQAYLQAESALQSNVELKKQLDFVEGADVPERVHGGQHLGRVAARARLRAGGRAAGRHGRRRRAGCAGRHGGRPRRPRHLRDRQLRPRDAADGRVERRLGARHADGRDRPRRARPDRRLAGDDPRAQGGERRGRRRDRHLRLDLGRPQLALSEEHPGRRRDERRPDPDRPVPAGADRVRCRLRVARRGRRAHPAAVRAAAR